MTASIAPDIVVNDVRSGVMLVRDSERLVAVWAQCYRIDRNIQRDEIEVRRRVRIHRGGRGAPILLTKRGTRSSFLTGRTLRKFELENNLKVMPVDLRDLDSIADSEFDRKWAALNAVERIQILELLADGFGDFMLDTGGYTSVFTSAHASASIPTSW
jgi:hypothetical protein